MLYKSFFVIIKKYMQLSNYISDINILIIFPIKLILLSY